MREEEYIMIHVLSTTAYIVIFCVIAIAAMVQLSARKKKMLLEKELLKVKFQQELMQVGTEIQEHTFRSISGEIHDNVGQLLSLAKLNLNILGLEANETQKILFVKELVNKAILGLRNLGSAYHAEELVSRGILPAIEYQVELLRQTGLFEVNYNSEFESLSLDSTKTIFMYRMIQESIQNIIRHSGASVVSISVFKQEDAAAIIIADNGKGFDTAAHDFNGGIGLRNMAYRSAMIGARIDIKSQTGMGTQITFICEQNEEN